MRFTGYSFGSMRVDGVTYDRRPHHRPRQGPQAQEGRVTEVPRRLRAYPALGRGGHPVAMPQAGHRHRRGRRAAGDAGGP